MPLMKEQLQKLLEEWNDLEQKNVDGINTTALLLLRGRITSYLRNQVPRRLEVEIAQIRTMHDIRVVLGCNPKGVVYDIVNARKINLIGILFPRPKSLAQFDSGSYSES